MGNIEELLRNIATMRNLAAQRKILEEELRQKEVAQKEAQYIKEVKAQHIKEVAQKKAQHIDELFDAIEYIIASSQKELDELEEARANMLEEIEQKRNQILQRMEALRSRVAKLGANQENIQPKKDERIREMEGK